MTTALCDRQINGKRCSAFGVWFVIFSNHKIMQHEKKVENILIRQDIINLLMPEFISNQIKNIQCCFPLKMILYLAESLIKWCIAN